MDNNIFYYSNKIIFGVTPYVYCNVADILRMAMSSSIYRICEGM